MQSPIVVVMLENENVDEKNMSLCGKKIEKVVVVVSGSRGLQKTELQDL